MLTMEKTKPISTWFAPEGSEAPSVPFDPPVEAAKLLKAGSKYMLLAILLLLSRGSASLS